MIFQDEHGEGVILNGSTLRDRFRLGTDEQIRGVFARLLRDAKIPSTRAAAILRTSRTQYFEDVKRPFPGINDDPQPLNRQSRVKPKRGADASPTR